MTQNVTKPSTNLSIDCCSRRGGNGASTSALHLGRQRLGRLRNWPRAPHLRAGRSSVWLPQEAGGGRSRSSVHRVPPSVGRRGDCPDSTPEGHGKPSLGQGWGLSPPRSYDDRTHKGSGCHQGLSAGWVVASRPGHRASAETPGNQLPTERGALGGLWMLLVPCFF